MGVQVRLVAYARDQEHGENAIKAAFARIAQLEDVASDYRPQSELMRLCARAGGPPVPVSDDLYVMLERSLIIARQSGGAFDISVGPYVALWREARRTRKFPSDEDLRWARERVGYQRIVLDPVNKTAQLKVAGMKLDLGGIAKGYAGDEAIKVLKEHGIESALYEAGGDIVVSGAPPGTPGWVIDVVNERRGRPSQKIFLKNAAVSTSGASFQYVDIGGKRYSHIVDPRTGIGLTETYLTTVIGPDGLTTDPLSKVASVLGREGSAEVFRLWPGVKVRFGYEE